MNDDIKTRVLGIVKKVTNKELVDLKGDLKTQLNLDSIQLVELFAALETELEVELPLEMMMISKADKFMERLEEEVNSQSTQKLDS